MNVQYRERSEHAINLIEGQKELLLIIEIFCSEKIRSDKQRLKILVQCASNLRR
jgi:hypothetical protein